MNDKKSKYSNRSRLLWLAFVVPTLLVMLLSASGPVLEAYSPPALDGVVDPQYAPGTTITYPTLTDGASAQLHMVEDATTVYLAWEISKEHVDNSYDDDKANILDHGTECDYVNGPTTNCYDPDTDLAHPSWAFQPKGKAHRFRDLAESDLQEIQLYNACGELAVYVTMDYLDGYGGIEGCGGLKSQGGPVLNVVDGYLDLNGDGLVSSGDNGNYFGYQIVGGAIDYLPVPPGVIDANDAAGTGTTFFQWQIIAGRLDTSGNNSVGTEDDAPFYGIALVEDPVSSGKYYVDIAAAYGTIDAADDTTADSRLLDGVPVIAGQLDLCTDGVIDSDDTTEDTCYPDETWNGYTVQLGVITDGPSLTHLYPDACGQSYFDATTHPSGYDANMDSAESIKHSIYGNNWDNFTYETSLSHYLNLYCSPFAGGGADVNGEGDCNNYGKGNPASVFQDLIGNQSGGLAESPDWQNPPGTDYLAANLMYNQGDPGEKPDWEYTVVYEMQIDQSVFNHQGTECTLDGINPFWTKPLQLHASPNKQDAPPVPIAYDFGDHESSYITQFADSATEVPPHHIIFAGSEDGQPSTDENGVRAIWMGNYVDIENDGVPTSDATGDNSAVPTDDEDGPIPTNTYLWTANGTGTMDLLLNSSEVGTHTAWVAIWFDWNYNGVFDDSELVSQQVTWTTASPNTPVTITLNSFSIPGTYNPNLTLKYRIRLFDQTTAPPAISTLDTGGPAYNGEIEDHLLTSGQLPVTLSYFEATREGDTTQFEWQTAAQVGTVGFNLYVETEDGLERVNEEIIPSHVIDSMSPLDYVYEADGITGDTFYIEDLSIDVNMEVHGPFELDEASGARVSSEPIDWAAIRAEHEQKETNRAAETAAVAVSTFKAGDLQQPSSSRGGRDAGRNVVGSLPELTIDLIVDEDGLYRVTSNELKDAGYDLSDQKVDDLALFNQGQAVPIYVKGKQMFKAGAYFEFYGKALDTPYSNKNIYTLTLDPGQALRIVEDGSKVKGKPEEFYMETLSLGEENKYLAQTPTEDPWVDTESLVYDKKTKVHEYEVAVDNYLPGEGPVTLTVDLWGRGSWDWLGVQNAHHLEVEFNNESVEELWFDGTVDASLSHVLAPSTLQSDNTLRVTHFGDTGAWWDFAYVDSYGVTYPRAFVARDGSLTFAAKGEVFTVTELPTDEVSVYRIVDGIPARMQRVNVAGGDGSYSATFAGAPESATYVVVTEGTQLSPAEIEEGRPYVDIKSEPAEFVIISHEDFVSDLAPLTNARLSQGFDVLVVNSEDVYDQFSYGIFDPQAIKDYITYAAQDLGTEYFLLVGGDTYDYRGYLGNGSMSFIPSFYEPVGAFNELTPVDEKYVDLDNNGVPDRSIGRFIVRNSAELALMIDKTLAYQSNVESSGGYAKTAIFAADDGYKDDAERHAGMLSDDWQVTNVLLDEYFANGESATDAKLDLMASINSGAALTTFMGHSSATGWTFNGLLKNADVLALENPLAPTVVSQWGCSNTYYVDPAYNTMAHHFLVSGDGGAAAVMGASGFSKQSSELKLGELLTPKLTQKGMTIGQAMLLAKNEMAAPAGFDPAKHAGVLLGWTLLGDPTVMVQP